MLFDLVDTLQENRRFLFVAAFILADFWLLTLCTQTLQTHRSDITARIRSTESYQASTAYQNDTLGISGVSASIDRAGSVVEVDMLQAAVTATDSVTAAEHTVLATTKLTVDAIGIVLGTTLRACGYALVFAGRIIAFPFVAVGHGVGYVFRGASELVDSHFVSAIQPKQHTAIPVITPEQAQQASLIQSGTLDFEPAKPTGSGGACDIGTGNGGYPMDWCNAPMDTVQTVSYSSDRINRECTSYAYWYFTVIEGRSDFHVTGNANRWAYTSNYPVYKAPTVGAIAVETAGAYGHVAIVQALPGQAFEGKAVPAGYVLVSEMNYDWYGHFRYSYSPLSKFSAYIYP